MRKNRFSILLLLSAPAGFFFGAELGGHSPAHTRSPSSVPASVNDLASLPCPTEEQFQALLKKVHMVTVLEGNSTCDSSRRGVLAKLLFLLDSLKVNPPEGWGGEAYEMLKSPVDYVGDTIPKMKVDLNQKNSVAYNAGQVEVNLGPMFFTSEPLFALMVLVHESRHSAPKDPAHERCRAGDIPKTDGGCDREFSTAEDAGAYSFSVLFYLGLAQFHPGLSEGDREYLRSAALTTLGNRFNEVPASLATPHDLLLGLGRSGKAYLLNPYELGAEPLPFSGAFARIEHNPRNGGAFFLNGKGQVFTWSRLQKMQRFEADLVPESESFKDVAKFYVGTDKYAYTAFLREDGALLYIENGNNSGLSTLERFRVQPQDVGLDPKRLFTADMFSSFVLGEDGKVYVLYMSPRGGHSGNRFMLRRPLAEKNWSQMTGGVVYDSLYGISDGQLFREGTLPGKSGFHPVLSSFQGQGRLVKYGESTGFRILLNEEGKLFLRRFENETESTLDLSGVLEDPLVDFAVIRHYAVKKLLEPNRRALADFLLHCQVREAKEEPWLGRPMGIGRNGHLVLASGNPEKPCLELRGLGQPEAFHFVESPPTKENNFYSQPALELSYQGGSKRFVYPYSSLPKSK